MEVLAESQVALGGLDRGVAERELDLLERGANEAQADIVGMLACGGAPPQSALGSIPPRCRRRGLEVGCRGPIVAGCAT